MQSIFHLAFNVTDLDETRTFYRNVLGCIEGRSTETWVDFNFFGHQISMHLGEPFKVQHTGKVGEHLVAMPHLGVVLQLEEWKRVAKRLEDVGTEFIIAPVGRFIGEVGEQYTMFFTDPSGNPIEIKGFKSLDTVFDA
ncbi:MAG TPA: dioxygenase [Epsilonproteobacteria bacterium]|nr:dioxygenase [Campylobacterota bacterium]